MMNLPIYFLVRTKKELELTISPLTFVNTNYILSKLKSAKEARVILRKFKMLVELLRLDDKNTELALNVENFPNFEDGLQLFCYRKSNRNHYHT